MEELKPFSTMEDAYAYILGFANAERGQAVVYGLDTMNALMEALGRPDREIPCVHIAGSKGKGSLGAMLACVVEELGKACGLYASPHVRSFSERISRAGRPFDDIVYARSAETLRAAVKAMDASGWPSGHRPSFFDMATALAFLCYREARMDIGVIETGLGGRLDSTNVISPALCLLTPIELEHTQWLGDTIGQIAHEKAGILKPGVPAISSAQRPEARDVFRSRASELGARLDFTDELASISEYIITREGTRAKLDPRDGGRPVALYSPMIGAVQASNAAHAYLAAKALFPSAPDAFITTGIAKARLPGRFEIARLDPPIVLDGAHTEASFASCLDSFASLFGKGILVFACAEDKDHAKMAAKAAERFGEAIVTMPGSVKRSDPSAVAASFREAGVSVRLIEDTALAARTAIAEGAKAGLPVLFAGSFYLCAEVSPIVESMDGQGRR